MTTPMRAIVDRLAAEEVHARHARVVASPEAESGDAAEDLAGGSWYAALECWWGVGRVVRCVLRVCGPAAVMCGVRRPPCRPATAVGITLVAAPLRARRDLPDTLEHLDAARDDLLAFAAFPRRTPQQIWSSNPQEG